jgi:microcystin degradation protein MlrC
MKIFTASISTETNTFAPAPTGYAAYEEFGIFHGAESLTAPAGVCQIPYLAKRCEADGHELVPSLCAFAQPSGRTVRSVYEAFRDEMLADLKRAMPVDAVILFLHGAMVAAGYDDCEGDMLSRVRAIVGPRVAIGAELDLHCHFTETMRASANVIIAFKEYPHDDAQARAAELYDLIVATAEGKVSPTTDMFDCKMVGVWRTTTQPMRSFVDRLKALEGRDGVLSISLGHGFPWGDVADGGARLWVVTDGDPHKARRLADSLGREFWSLRESTRPPLVGVDEALDRAATIDGGPSVFADVADNPGGGAPSDSTFILRRMVERGIGNAVLGAFWDIGAIQICKEAGEGATLDLRIGGKCGPASGSPVDLRVTVRAIRDDHGQDVFGARWPMGRSVWVEAEGGLHLVLCSIRGQVYGIDAYTGLGLTLEDKKIVVVKSTQHFYGAFAPIAKAIVYVETPGALTSDFEHIPYRKRALDYWPRMADPHHGALD